MRVLEVLLNMTIAIAVMVGLFVVANKALDLAIDRFRWFAAVVGAAAGAFAGAVADSSGATEGLGPPTIGAVTGAVVGFVAGRWTPKPTTRRRIVDGLRPVVFLFPALLFLTVALVIPAIRTIYLSLRNRRGTEFVGIDNYRTIIHDDDIFTLHGFANIFTSRLFIAGLVIAVAVVVIVVVRNAVTKRGIDVHAPLPVIGMSAALTLVVLAAVGAVGAVIWNNLFWVFFTTAASTVFGLAIAVLADRSRGESVAKSFIFMPMAISFVGASVIWRFVYAFTPEGSDQIGLLNAVWVGIGGHPQVWIQQAHWNNLFLIAIMIWIQTGFAMVILSAAIKGVPNELLEAARMDGASEGQIFWNITLPHIRPTLAVVTTTLIITVLKVYDIVKVMTNGQFGTEVIANRQFNVSFINRDYGLGSALAVVLFAAVLPMMIFNVRRNRRQEGAN